MCVNIKVQGVHVDGSMCDTLVVPESAVIDIDGLTVDRAAMVAFLANGVCLLLGKSRSPFPVSGHNTLRTASVCGGSGTK